MKAGRRPLGGDVGDPTKAHLLASSSSIVGGQKTRFTAPLRYRIKNAALEKKRLHCTITIKLYNNRTSNAVFFEQKMSNITQKETPSGELNLEWSYSGKAMRGQMLFFCLLSLAAIGGGVYATFAELLGATYLPVWFTVAGGLLLLWGYFYAVYFYRVWTIKYRLTDQRLYMRRGLLTRTSDSMELIHIDDVRLVQTLVDRLINGGVGSIIILCSADKTHPTLILTGIDHPREIFEKIDLTRTALRAKRSILTGA